MEKIQRRAARYVKGVYRHDASVTDMLNELQWESLESRREKFPMYLPSKYIPEFHSQTLQYQLQTRSSHTLRLTEMFCNTDAYKYSFLISLPRLWNSLPRHIIKCTSVESFKLALRNYYHGLHS